MAALACLPGVSQPGCVPLNSPLPTASLTVRGPAGGGQGEIEVDQSAMTGESLPVKFRPGDVCKMGSTVTRG